MRHKQNGQAWHEIRKSQGANYSLISVGVNESFFSRVKGGKDSKEGRKERKVKWEETRQGKEWKDKLMLWQIIL